MTHPLDRSINQIRSSARRIALGYGIGVTLAVLIGAVVLTSLLDYYLRVDALAVRLLLTGTVLLVAGVAVIRYLLPAVRGRLSDVAVAQRLQDRFPALGDRLASAVEFLQQPEESPTAGSVMLRHAVIVEATAETKSLPLREVLDYRPLRHALYGAALGLVVVTAVAMAWPEHAQIGLTRLVNPLSAAQWPRANHLAFVEPKTRMAAGQTFEVELFDRFGKLPDDVQIEYRFGDDANSDANSRAISEPMRAAEGKMTAVRENVQRSFSYRAVGGDDHTMTWIRLTVVEPARLESFSVAVRPPPYTGWPEETSNGPVAALVGTQLVVKGLSSKPLKGVAVRQDNGTVVPGRVEPDGRSFVVPAPGGEPLTVKESGNYWIEMTDQEDVASGADRRFAMRAVPDEPPTVALEKPTADLYLTPQGKVPLQVLAKDQLAIKSIDVSYTRSDKSDEGTKFISLYSGPKEMAPTDTKGLALAADKAERRVVKHELDLAELKLPPGSQLAIQAAATDYQPAVGQSPAVRVFIITPRELEERLARQQAQVLSDLAKAVKMEREARGRVRELEIQMQQVGRLEKSDVDQLQAADLKQREVRRLIAGGTEGARQQIANVQEQLAGNKLNSPELARRMAGLGGLLDALEKQQLPAAEQELATALKNAQLDRDRNGEKNKDAAAPKNGAAPKDPAASKDGANAREGSPQQVETDRALGAAGAQQDQVIASLEGAISELKRWDKYREFGRELSGVEVGQQKARQQTAELLGKTLGKDAKDLTPQDVANLKKQAERQAELAREFNKIAEGMQRTQKELEQSDPLAAQSLDDALAQARQSSVAQKMASASSQIDQNQVASALKQQSAANKGLQEMLDVLSNRREQELSRLVNKLREAEKKLSELRQQQSALRKKMQDAAKKTAPEERRREMQQLSREQEELQKEAQRLARRLERLDARRSADKLAKAGGKMGQAGEECAACEAQQADDQAGGAEKDLEEAQQQLAQERRQAEIDLVQEQLVRLKDELQGLEQQQQVFLEETQRLEGLRKRQRQFTRGQEGSVVSLARNQEDLGKDVAQMARKLSAAEGFGLALSRASAEMARAAASLARLNTGAESQQAEQRALGRLKLVLDALQPETPESDMENPGGGMGQQPGGKPKQQQPPPSDGIHTLQELKLLKLMQQEVRERTDAIEARKRAGEQLEDSEVAELADLADEQGRLADLMLKLREPVSEAPEDNPDKLPGDEPTEDKEIETQRHGDTEGEKKETDKDKDKTRLESE